MKINRDNSHSVNRDNSHSENRDNSHSENRDNSHSENRHNSHSVNWDNSHSVNWDNSHSVNRHNSHSVNWDNSHSENWHNSHSVNWDNSHSVNWDNSHSVNRDNSHSVGFGCSVIHVKSLSSTVEAYDNVTVYCHVEPKELKIHGDNVTVIRADQIVTPTFEDWLERGYVVADGMTQKLVSKKSQGEVTIYKTEDFKKETFYVAQKGDKFAHSKSASEAISDLRYKISSRDTTRFESWSLEDKKSLEDLIEAYRVITGACAEGTKIFCESETLKDKMTVKEAIKATQGQYGSEQFKGFFGGGE